MEVQAVLLAPEHPSGLALHRQVLRVRLVPVARSLFHRVRLWDAKAVVENLLAKYDRLPADLRAEIPLKRIWVVAAQEESA